MVLLSATFIFSSLSLSSSVGKTAFTSLLVEWYVKKATPFTLLDLDTENKSRGSLGHFFPEARKVNIHTSQGLDTFVDVLDEGKPLVIADMGAGAARWRIAGLIRCFPRSRKSGWPSLLSEL